MNVPIRMLGIATTIFWVILAGFIASAGYSLKDLNFSIGEPQFTTTSDRDMVLSLPLYVFNGGFYSLKGFNLTTVFSDAEGAEVSRSSTFVPTIPHGQNTTILHNVTLNMDKLAENDEQYLFNDTSLNAEVTAGLNFAELLPVQLSTNFTFPWGAPLYDLTLGQPRFRSLSRSNAAVTVPISFENHAAFDLNGTIHANLYDKDGTLLAESQTPLDVSKGSSYAGNLDFAVPLNTASQASATGGHIELHFSTSMFEYGLVVMPIG